MRILRSFLEGVARVIGFINSHFKTFVFLFIVFWILVSSLNSSVSLGTSFANLERIDLKGEIVDSSHVLEKIINAKNDTNIKGVLFVIDSPGGAFAPSMELALAIKDLKKEKPVVTYASGTMASGSYLSGVGANLILANPASFIGSIGVLMQGVNLGELAEKLGIKEQSVKAGTFKEAGTFIRAWSREEREYLQNLTNQSYELFTGFVARERKLSLKDRRKWADARVFLASQAKELGLIDELSSYENAKKKLESLAKVKNPIWKEEDKFDKFLNRLSEQGIKTFGSMLTQLSNMRSLQVF